jgi:hypothetical protein
MSWPGLILGQEPSPAAYEQMERLGSGFRSAPANNDLFAAVVGTVALLAVVALVLYFLGRRRRHKIKPRPNYLAEAGRILGLTREERSSLKRLAARAQLPYAAAMLLSPANLAHALHRNAPGAGDVLLQSRVEALSLRLFGQPPHAGDDAADPTTFVEPRRPAG